MLYYLSYSSKIRISQSITDYTQDGPIPTVNPVSDHPYLGYILESLVATTTHELSEALLSSVENYRCWRSYALNNLRNMVVVFAIP
jgi:hypothetical protein